MVDAVSPYATDNHAFDAAKYPNSIRLAIFEGDFKFVGFHYIYSHCGGMDFRLQDMKTGITYPCRANHFEDLLKAAQANPSRHMRNGGFHFICTFGRHNLRHFIIPLVQEKDSRLQNMLDSL